MKTDRLYAITLYLLNHGKTSASALARHFEVSIRTIQRDIDSLCQADIPIIAETGVGGGYYLAESFRMDAQTATAEDYARILTALKGYLTAFSDAKTESTLEKIATLTKQKNESIILDFSVLRETNEDLMKLLQDAIKQKKAVRFQYTNTENVSRLHTVEPIALVYRWYAWYLLAYSTIKDDYRTYKLIRMCKAEMTAQNFTKEHESAERILENSHSDTRMPTIVNVYCKASARAKAIEYLNGEIAREYDNGDCDMNLYVIESEHLWFGTLLSLGDDIIVKEPLHIRERMKIAAEKISNLY
ncbi:MAG: YafY family transcriptional regulator [Clostridia bacterium]|nr:YafY family transcriptional regulator [Clostridia bacterium]